MFRWVARIGTASAGPEPPCRGPGHAIGSLVTVALAVLVVFFLAAGRLSSTAPVQPLPRRLIAAVGMVMPQGWAFFTKSPRSEAMRVWVETSEGAWRARKPTHSGSPSSWFGMDREPRTEGLQLAFIQTPLSAERERWVSCTVRRVHDCLAQSQPLDVLNPSPTPAFCGKVGIELHPAKPFEWRDLPNNEAPTRVATLNVRCPNGAGS